MNVYNYNKEKNIQEENSIDFKKLFLSDHQLKSNFYWLSPWSRYLVVINFAK